jgi:hypothetical protein
MGKMLKIRDDLSAEALRRSARREKDGRAAARMYAIANALDGLSRAEAARRAGMERQALRDAVVRYNAEGLAGLHDRAKGRPRRRLDPSEEADLAAAILRGPDPAADGCCAWTRADPLSLARDAPRQDLPSVQHGRRIRRRCCDAWTSPARRRGPTTPSGTQRRRRPSKRGLAEAVATAAARHPDKRIELWFEE